MITKRRIVFFITFIVLLLVSTLLYYNIQVKSLTKLGYSNKQAKNKVAINTIYNVVTREKNELEGNVSKQKQELLSLGVRQENIAKIDNESPKLVTKVATLESSKKQREESVNTSLVELEDQAATFDVQYKYPSTNSYGKYKYLRQHLLANYSNKIKDYQKKLKKQGYSNSQIKKLSKNSTFKTMLNLKGKVDKEQKIAKKIKKLNGFQSLDLKKSAIRMFNETNTYRKSKGLKPYKYNNSMQSCVFREAKAYSENKKPHNWLCKEAANENAGLASASSDYVKAAMDFFISDPPHEAVLSGKYNSVAIAIVQKDGMNYMIMDVFY